MPYFVQVAELGSFTRAASILRVAQPALSRQVRSLKVELRQPLFDRHGRGVMLTPAGQRLLAHGRGILQQLERARRDLEDTRGAAAGRLSIGLPPSISRTLTAPLVETFQAAFPRARLTVVEGLSTYTLEWLAQGRVDCAVVYNAAAGTAYDLLPVMDEELYLVSARTRRAARTAANPLLGTPLPLAELAMRELAIPSQPHAIRMRLETVLAAAGLRPAIGLEIESVPAMLDLVQRQPLHAVLSLNAIVGSGMQARLQARPIVMPPMGNALRGMPLSTTLSVATSAHRPRGPLLEQALPVLRTLLQARLGMAHSSQGPDAEPERRGRPATEDPPAGRTNRPPAQGGPR